MGKKRINGEGTFYHDTNRGNWQYKLVLGYDEQEKPIRKTFYGKTQDEARQKGKKALEELEGKTVSVSPDIKFGDWLLMYLENYKKGTVRNQWYNYLIGLYNKIPKNLKNKKICKITPIEIQKLINELSTSYSKTYVKKMKILIKSALTEAQENNIINKNPARKITVPEKPEKPRESYTAKEATILIRHATAHKNKIIATATITMLLTGIRRGEMLGLMWSDIENETLHIKRGVFLENNKPKVEEYRAKTKESIRAIPIPKLLQELLNELPKTCELIFPTRNGNIIEPHSFNRCYKRMIKQIQENEPGLKALSPHCLRHTYATLTLEANKNLRNVQELLGHTDPKTTAKYTHPNIEELKKSSTQLMELLQDNQQDNGNGRQQKTKYKTIENSRFTRQTSNANQASGAGG